ncbi:major facilitator superfamily domain-containing protein 6-like isoform X1 [Paramormyrops kingsleyae]|uniref:major facilitator superfamily domain-containing protein 6-like isoform X1 n=1 Tax=Paramormyrops kingsleyae TaxID=1676925 RepID=UPI000CD62FE0|nr:major facilitator superfamily domain-containing protein 6-A-like isoform X1 [Paramormyrops kingsleyae]XP_023670605.1 major facilitator superfamily domain-containing protein 6-A-like isoform X1 [Paramormyrops kingsleyae]
MASDDRTGILMDDETDQRWNDTLDELDNTEPAEEKPRTSSPVPAPESPQSDAATTSSQPGVGTVGSTFGQVNKHLLVSKIFYFFFYAAYGSLHPLLPIYFKQLGMTASRSGLLVGIRYFIEFCSAPFWGVIADRFKKGKAVLLFSVLCFLLFNGGIGFVKPAEMHCVEKSPPEASNNSAQANTTQVTSTTQPMGDNSTHVSTPQNATSSGFTTEQFTATTVASNTHELIYDEGQVKTIFLTILLVIIIGEFFSAPAVTIVDTVTLQYLGRHRDRYGLQRMWGALGWGLAMLCVGISIDHMQLLVLIQDCGLFHLKDFLITFVVFGVLAGLALLVATQFSFDSSGSAVSRGVYDSASPGAIVAEGQREFHFSDLLRVLCSVRYSTVLFVAWFMGFGYGFVFSFLYWYLQTLNGTTTLFGICSVLSHVSELVAYFTSHKLIKLVGHIRVLYLGLACNTARYLYISYLENAWTVLPMEVLQGMTHALVWAACISYLSATVPLALRTSTQGVLQGLHLGLGRGCGAMVGGVFVSYFGEAATFRGLGMASLIILILFSFIQFLMGQDDSGEAKAMASSGSVSIATINLTREPQTLQPEPPRKRKHQEEQEDRDMPPWAFTVSPWVTMAFTIFHVLETIKMAKRRALVDTQDPQQVTNDTTAPVSPPVDMPAAQPSTSQQLEPSNKPVRRPSKKLKERTDSDGTERPPSTAPPVGSNSTVDNHFPLPGNFDLPPHRSSNNPFYQ